MIRMSSMETFENSLHFMLIKEFQELLFRNWHVKIRFTPRDANHVADRPLVVSNICRYYAMACRTEANVEDETDFMWGSSMSYSLIRVWSIFCMIVSSFTKQVILKLPLQLLDL
ncbi:uncharacterized protein G2W53_026826 [Senna tora]|uniref:Uncharacterized protein n=1 Tax=Senna tora TaxID=362788 RepID=A0A834THR7_9FABA|nr:uncharacterized protein G2W53_026826 [Senna tora]